MTKEPVSGSVTKRNAAQTRERLVRAASEEFAEHGFSGARIERITASAQANPRMIYVYFGSKMGLFEAVLDVHVAETQTAVRMDAFDLPGYAVALHDFYAQRPMLVRLALWQELELGRNVSSLRRASDALAARIAAIEDAQRQGAVASDMPAAILFDQIQAIAVGNLVGRGIGWDTAHREHIADSVARIVGGQPY